MITQSMTAKQEHSACTPNVKRDLTRAKGTGFRVNPLHRERSTRSEFEKYRVNLESPPQLGSGTRNGFSPSRCAAPSSEALLTDVRRRLPRALHQHAHSRPAVLDQVDRLGVRHVVRVVPVDLDDLVSHLNKRWAINLFFFNIVFRFAPEDMSWRLRCMHFSVHTLQQTLCFPVAQTGHSLPENPQHLTLPLGGAHSLTRSLPSRSAAPPSAIRSTNSGIELNSRPPRIEKPKPRDPRCSSTW